MWRAREMKMETPRACGPDLEPASGPGEHGLALFHERLAAFLVVVAGEALLHQPVGERDVARGIFA